MTADDRFRFQLTDPRHGDIAPFLWTIRRYAAASRTIVELGVDDCSSTVAFLLGRPERLWSYDLWRQKEVDEAEVWAKELGVEFEFHVGDSREIDIPRCELLFVDTDHSAESTLTELRRHSVSVSRYLLLHDTTACGDYAPDLSDYNGPWIPPGIWAGSIGPFLREGDGLNWNLSWVMQEHPGLTCLTRRP